MATRKPRFLAGGPDEPDTGVEEAPKVLRYPCAAHGCPMPGVVYLGGSQDGVCGWHAREPAHDWPKITQALADWDCVVRANLALRRVLVNPETCADPAAQNRVMAEQKRLLADACGDAWGPRVLPIDREMIGSWARRLDVFLGARVKERVAGNDYGVLDESKPTHATAAIRQGLRDTPLGNPNNMDFA